MKAPLGFMAGLVAAALLAWIPVASVQAHAELTKSSPASGATLAHSPSMIQAWFSEELAVKGSTMRLYNSQGKVLATGGVDSMVSNHQVMKVIPPHLSAGAYMVRWHAVAADDNAVTQDSFHFSVSGAASMSSGAMAMSLPAIQIIAPASHASVTNPVTLVIETPGDMKTMTMGSMASMSNMGSMSGTTPGVHLHIVTDGATAMPSADQLTKVGENRYKYSLPLLPAGAHTVKVYWADNKTHAVRGALQTVTFSIPQ